MNRQKVYLVDDDAAIRDAVRTVLELSGVSAEVFASGEEFLTRLRPDWSGCVLLDFKLTGMDGLQVQREILDRQIVLPVVIMTAHGDVATVKAALKAGAFDFLEKPVERAQLLDVIHRVFDLDDRTRREVAQRDELRKKAGRLTPRERQIMQHLVEGRQHREIAELLDISPRTVEVYKSRMMEKLGARSLADVIHMGVRLSDGAI